jgi:hypothetical protein
MSNARNISTLGSLTADNSGSLMANEWHELEALEDGTVFVNVFAEGKY